MALTNGVGIIDKTIQALSTGVFGSLQATGLFIVVLLFIFGVMLRLPMVVILVILFPIHILLLVFGFTYGVAFGIHALIILIVLGFNFLKQK